MPSRDLEVGNDGVKIIAFQPEGHAVALQKSPIVVPGEPGVVHLVGQPRGNFLIDAYVQKGFHHAGLRNGGTAAHRKKQGIGRVPNRFPVIF
jgi:hypothetical protein